MTNRKILIVSAGLTGMDDKSPANLPYADYYLDARAVPEPDGISGEMPAAQLLTRNRVHIPHFMGVILEAIERIPARAKRFQDLLRPDVFVICVFCGWGINRSPAMKNIIADELEKLGYTVERRRFDVRDRYRHRVDHRRHDGRYSGKGKTFWDK